MIQGHTGMKPANNVETVRQEPIRASQTKILVSLVFLATPLISPSLQASRIALVISIYMHEYKMKHLITRHFLREYLKSILLKLLRLSVESLPVLFKCLSLIMLKVYVEFSKLT